MRSECLIVVCTCFNITPTPASSLTPQYLCKDKAYQYPTKTLKVYLAAIHLMYIENGLTDPTTNEPLCLLCRGICPQQNSSEFIKLSITINLLRTRRSQLCFSHISLLEQCLLWTAFMLSFYGFLHSSECINLTWLDIHLYNGYISITLRQLKINPFQRGQSAHIKYATSTITCPVQSMRNYNDMLVRKQLHHLVLSATIISPLSLPQLITILCELLS